MLPAVFVDDSFFPVIEKDGMSVDSFKIDILLLLSFQGESDLSNGIWLKIDNNAFKSYEPLSKELTFF
jgi:hypothetical protein